MRIIGEIPHNSYKITVFEMNKKLSVKIEDRVLEQTYKFREGSGIDTVQKAESIMTDQFLEKVSDTFSMMYDNYIGALESIEGDEDLAFEII